MDKISLNLERHLWFEIDGIVREGLVRIIEIGPVEASRLCFCSWNLSYLHPEPGRIFGDDPLDALIRCHQFLRALIERSGFDGSIVWRHERGDFGGF